MIWQPLFKCGVCGEVVHSKKAMRDHDLDRHPIPVEIAPANYNKMHKTPQVIIVKFSNGTVRQYAFHSAMLTTEYEALREKGMTTFEAIETKEEGK